jgi:predicted RecB family nuclease
MKGLQCPKALWLFKNRKDLAAEPDQRRLNLFATGHCVGDLAKQLFPGGVEVEYRQSDYQGMTDQTALLMQSENVVYEGSFSTDGVFVRADILVKNGDAWDIFEVKATASTKTVHKPDVAIQWHVISQHLSLNKAYLVHLNTGYVRSGELDIQGLFTIDDVTEAVHAELAVIEDNLNRLKTVRREQPR